MRSQFKWDEADDLAQDVFVAALQGIDAGAPREPSKLPAYMVGICKNVARRRIGDIVKNNTVDIADSDFPGHEVSVEDRLIGKSLVRAVQKVLRTLSARDREALIREFYFGQDRSQASRELGVSRDRLRLILCRALQRFGAKWNDA